MKAVPTPPDRCRAVCVGGEELRREKRFECIAGGIYTNNRPLCRLPVVVLIADAFLTPARLRCVDGTAACCCCCERRTRQKTWYSRRRKTVARHMWRPCNICRTSLIMCRYNSRLVPHSEVARADAAVIYIFFLFVVFVSSVNAVSFALMQIGLARALPNEKGQVRL